MGLFGVFLLQSYKWIGWDGLGWVGLGSLCGAIVRAPLCGANNAKAYLPYLQEVLLVTVGKENKGGAI